MEESRYFTPPETLPGSATFLTPHPSASSPLKRSPYSPQRKLPTPPIDTLTPSLLFSTSPQQTTHRTTLPDSLALSAIPTYLRLPIPSFDRLYNALKTPFPTWYNRFYIRDTTPEDIEALRQRYPFPEEDEGEEEEEMPIGYPYDTYMGVAGFAWEYVSRMTGYATCWVEKQDRMRVTT